MHTIRCTSWLSLSLLTLVAGTAAAEDRGPPGLALGDSVAFGYITAAGHEYVNAGNFIGAPEYLADLLHMSMTNAACPGETTGSALSSTAEDNGCHAFRSVFPLHVSYSSTQMAFATAFLRQHPDARLVTLGVGANDIFLLQNSCASNANPQQCVQVGLPMVLGTIGANVANMLVTLRAAGFSGAIVVVNYYSPDYSDPTDLAITTLLNQAITTPARAYGAAIADVFTAFQTATADPLVGGSPCNAGLLNVDPANQALCDVHPTQSGQRLIARTIARAYRTVAR